MSKDFSFEEYAKKLSEKVANIPPKEKHIMEIESTNDNDLKKVLEDLKYFLNNDLLDFQKYECWLEDKSEPNQKG